MASAPDERHQQTIEESQKSRFWQKVGTGLIVAGLIVSIWASISAANGTNVALADAKQARVEAAYHDCAAHLEESIAFSSGMFSGWIFQEEAWTGWELERDVPAEQQFLAAAIRSKSCTVDGVIPAGTQIANGLDEMSDNLSYAFVTRPVRHPEYSSEDNLKCVANAALAYREAAEAAIDYLGELRKAWPGGYYDEYYLEVEHPTGDVDLHAEGCPIPEDERTGIYSIG